MATQTQTGGGGTEPALGGITPHRMAEPPPAAADMDGHSKRGWDFFTKFLLWNVLTIVVILVFIGFLTVWR